MDARKSQKRPGRAASASAAPHRRSGIIQPRPIGVRICTGVTASTGGKTGRRMDLACPPPRYQNQVIAWQTHSSHAGLGFLLLPALSLEGLLC